MRAAGREEPDVSQPETLSRRDVAELAAAAADSPPGPRRVPRPRRGLARFFRPQKGAEAVYPKVAGRHPLG